MSEQKPTRQQYEAQIVELYHNIYRMHGYLEAALGAVGTERPGLLVNADNLLRASYARAQAGLTEWYHLQALEYPPGERERTAAPDTE